MAKTKGLIILFCMFLSSAAFAEEIRALYPEKLSVKPVNVTYNAQAYAVCVTIQSEAVCVTIEASPLNVTQTTEYFEDMINLKVNELHLNITPSFKVVLPDASVNIGLKQKIGDTILEGSTEYNYIYNRIKYDLKYGLETIFPVYVRLYDDLEFEQIYNNTKYIQRTKGLGLSIGTPLLLSSLKFGEEFKNESAYLAHLNNTFDVEQGVESRFNTWMDYRLAGKQGGNEFDMVHLSINFDKAIPYKDSRYNFLFLNSSISGNIRFDNGNNLYYAAETGHMLEAQDAPLWTLYNMGGFDKLIGYGLNEFQGYYQIFGRLRFDAMVEDKIGWEVWWVMLDNLKAFAIVDCGRIGDVHIIQHFNSYLYGVGAGVSFQFMFRKRTPVKVTFALGQAVPGGRKPVVYFVYELL